MRVLIAIPALNEEKVLRATVETVRRFADRALAGHDVVIVVADNGSDDGTGDVGRALAAGVPGTRYLRIDRRGKGLAVRTAWTGHDADAYVFMDADLATDLAALPELLVALDAGAGLAVGSRYHPAAVVRRSPFRRILSRGYRELLACAFGTAVADAPCGFKAASAALVRDVVPQVRDDGWFFDTELVIRAERAGHRVVEVPVSWSESQPAGRRSKVRAFSLAREYATKVFGLRRALGSSPRRGPRSGLRDLLASISPRERALIALTAAVVAAITTIPAIIGVGAAARAGMEWSGRLFLSPGDYGVYLSYIAQAKDGTLLLRNMATTEPLTPVFNLLWVAVGLFARLLDLTPRVAFHVSRVLLLFPFAVVAYAAVAYVFRGVRRRAAAFLLFMFGSGFGALLWPFLPAAYVGPGRYEWPIDLWVGEANAFLSMLYTPHFVASWTLITLALLLLLMAYDADDWRHGAWAGLAGLALFQFHPFHAPTLYAVGLVALLVTTRKEGVRAGQWAAYGAFVAVSAPSVACHYWLTHFTPNGAFMLANNLTFTPSPFFLVAGLGATCAFAVIGVMRDREIGAMSPAHRRFFLAWAVTQLLLAYAPLNFQRRLLQGVQFPLVLLSVPALIAWYRAVRRRSQEALVVAATLLAVAVLPSTAFAVLRNVDAHVRDEPPVFRIDADRAAAYAWLRDMTPKDAVVLSGIGEGEAVMGFGERGIYAGHWANTVDLPRKAGEIARFFDRAVTNKDRAAFLAAKDIDFVFEGPDERRDGGMLDRDPSLSEAFRSGGIVVYRVIR